MISKINRLIGSQDVKRLFSNFFSLSILQFFSYFLPLLTMPYLVRVLGVDNFGLVMFAQAFIVFFNILVDYGFNLSATREISINRENKYKTTEIFSSVIQIKCVLIIIAFLLLTIIVFSFEKFSNDWILYYLTFLTVIGQALFPIWYFQGMEKMKYITIVNIVSKIIFTFAIFIFIQNSTDYILVPILNGLGSLTASLISIYIIKKNFNQKFIVQDFKTLLSYFKDSSQFFLSRVSVSLYTSSNTFILGILASTTAVGYYSIAHKLYTAMQSLYGPITQSLYPYISKYRNISLFKKIFYLVTSLNVIGVIFIYAFGEYLFNFLFTKEVGVEAIKVFNILLFANIVIVPSFLLGYPFLGALGFAKKANLSVMYGSLIHLLGLLSLTYFNKVSIYSVAYMVIATESLVLLIRFFWSKNYLIGNMKNI